MSGLLERLIEDWLTKSDERSYQLSFGSWLSIQGHVIKYMSPHGPLEHGKDIVARAQDGCLEGYQLKAGDIDGNGWRRIEGEVRELSRLPWRDPAGKSRLMGRAFLVATGRITDSARDKLNLMNDDLATNGFVRVQPVELDELVARFKSAFDTFFPRTIRPFDEFMGLYLRDGRGWQSKVALCKNLKDLLISSPRRSAVWRRSCSNAVVAAEFLATPFREHRNHIAVIDTWVVTACQILRFACEGTIPPRHYRQALEFCKQGVEVAATELLEEALQRDDYVEGDPLLDAYFLPYRRWVVLGYMAAVINARAMAGADMQDLSRRLLAKIEQEQPVAFWGEGAWNFMLEIALALRHTPNGSTASEGLVARWLQYACPARGEWPRDPYRDVADELSPARIVAEATNPKPERMRLSYSAESAVGFLARRIRRQTLSRLWRSISRFDHASMMAERPCDYFDWHMKNGVLEVKVLPITGSWKQLRGTAATQRSDLFADEAKWLLPYFLCTFPHRVHGNFSGELDHVTSDAAFKSEWVS